jgi:signal transduction histidine kinase
MGACIRSMDWSRSPLGPLDSWPQSLRTTVGLCLASNFPISLAWGPQAIQIYNDGYYPICGGKHPQSMGQDFRVCWDSPWPVIGESFERARRGETSYLEDQRMFLDRNGYFEETFFTFSFSPIRDESGEVAGLFHPVTETTAKMISQRRTRTLRDLAGRAGKAQAPADAYELAGQALFDCELDVPFLLVYRVDTPAKAAHLVTAVHVERGSQAAPLTLSLDADPGVTWPLGPVARTNEPQQVPDVGARFPELRCGPYPEPPTRALVLPITPRGCTLPVAIMVAGVSSRLPLNEPYRGFFDLLSASVTAAVANGRAYEEERKRSEALAEIDRSKTAFFSNVSHEFRTPLTLMLGPLEDELAEKVSPLPGPRRERLETAHRNTTRLLKLVNTLLDFSRIEAGRVQAQYQPTDLAAQTTDLVSLFRSACEKAQLALTVECPPLAERVHVDRDMWEKIVLNLLSNAFKHTFEGGITVRLRPTPAGDAVELAVEDTGVGVAAEDLPRLFERFHRVQGARSRSHEGTGIGLALVHELAAMHGGSVRVASDQGKGTTFTVSIKAGTAHLPAERVGPEREAAPATTRATAYVEEAFQWLRGESDNDPAPSSGARRSTLPPPPLDGIASSRAPEGPRARIVLADDNADMRDYVRRLLIDRYDVVAVGDGLAALEAAAKAPVDLVLSDVMMPRLDGIGLLRALRGDPRWRTVPVILLSARAGEEASVEGLEAGADDYLEKPFSARALLARVNTHLTLARIRRKASLELEAVNKELEAFSYSVSHDLRAPLRAIDGFSRELLEQKADQLDDEGRSHLNRVCTATTRMSSLIDDLLGLSQIARTHLARAPVSLSKIARAVIDELGNREPARRVAVDVESNLHAEGDPRLLTILFENVLGNAWKFTAKTPEARIQVGKTGGSGAKTFFVRDNGAGFDMAYAERLFQPFSRLHLRSDFDGSGVGLATVQRVVSRHGGRVWAEGAVGQGATLFFTLGAER